MTTSEWTETALPLPRPPVSELSNPVAIDTIARNPELFKVVTPIKINIFESLLSDHPNQPFVQSVCDGLRFGFWPWATTLRPDYPTELDLSQQVKLDSARAAFLTDQLIHEQEENRYSDSFGSQLLPGMYCMPIFVVPKPHSDKFRLVNDHSASKFSLNSMINHNFVVGYPMDNLAQFGDMLTALHLENLDLHGTNAIIAWKSDISEAYRICPVHPFWQLKQAAHVDGLFYVDRCIVFGSSASPAIFIAFNSLVTWIAKKKRGIPFITTYLDDSSGCAWSDDVTFYPPYSCNLPTPQARLLSLWDEIGVPHKPKKQISGKAIPIIGITVDPNSMTYALSDEALSHLIDELRTWTKPKGRHTVRRWQQLGGWMNWALNVYPLLRPALNNVYPKLKGKLNRNQTIWVNNAVRDDLQWALDKIVSSDGLLHLQTVSWVVNSADFTIFCDACPSGMGFWYPSFNEGFLCGIPDPCNDLNFFYEALCVLCALRDACLRSSSPCRIIIYTDNLNTVDIFASLRALPAYNIILRAAVDLLYAGGHDLRVLHVSGEDNAVADALSRQEYARAWRLQPGLTIDEFEPFRRVKDGHHFVLLPPRCPLGASQK